MYGVIGSKSRKISKVYGVIGSTSRGLKKVYGVVGGVTRLIYQSGIESGEKIFTSSGTFVVPSGMKILDIFCVGGGGGCGGGRGTYTWKENTLYAWGYEVDYEGTPGASGYTSTALSVSVTPGDTLTVTVGAGGEAGLTYYVDDGSSTGTASSLSAITNGGNGGISQVTNGSGTVLCTANGGQGGNKHNTTTSYVAGVNGGSGGNAAGTYKTGSSAPDEYWYTSHPVYACDGIDGYKMRYYTYKASTDKETETSYQYGTGGTGQGTTTKYFAESNGTLYSNAGSSMSRSNASNNTGNGGNLYFSEAYKGGSGIVILRWSKQ